MCSSLLSLLQAFAIVSEGTRLSREEEEVAGHLKKLSAELEQARKEHNDAKA